MCVVEMKGFLGITHLNYMYAIVLVVGNGQQGQCMLENDMKEHQHSLMSGLGAPNPRICSLVEIEGVRATLSLVWVRV